MIESKIEETIKSMQKIQRERKYKPHSKGRYTHKEKESIINGFIHYCAIYQINHIIDGYCEHDNLGYFCVNLDFGICRYEYHPKKNMTIPQIINKILTTKIYRTYRY